MSRGFKELASQGRVTSTYLPSDLFQYVEAVGKVRNLPISGALRAIIKDHFDNFVKDMKPPKGRRKP